MGFGLPASVWEGAGEQKLMSSDMHIATMMAKRKTQESEEAKKNISFQCLPHVCLQSAASDSEGFFSPSVCFLRITEVFLLTQGCIRVDKVNDPERRTGIVET